MDASLFYEDPQNVPFWRYFKDVWGEICNGAKFKHFCYALKQVQKIWDMLTRKNSASHEGQKYGPWEIVIGRGLL